jgi:hypothetical protein
VEPLLYSRLVEHIHYMELRPVRCLHKYCGEQFDPPGGHFQRISGDAAGTASNILAHEQLCRTSILLDLSGQLGRSS